MYQKIIVVGNLGGDPEMRYMQNGNAVTNFSLATSRRYKKGDDLVDETTWFRITVWGRQAETCNQYLAKGRKVLVEGRMKQSEPFQKRDGTWACSLELVADTVKFLSSRGDDSYSDGGGMGGGYSNQSPAQEEDDIPF